MRCLSLLEIKIFFFKFKINYIKKWKRNAFCLLWFDEC